VSRSSIVSRILRGNARESPPRQGSRGQSGEAARMKGHAPKHIEEEGRSIDRD
jgi:hypothetical protein